MGLCLYVDLCFRASPPFLAWSSSVITYFLCNAPYSPHHPTFPASFSFSTTILTSLLSSSPSSLFPCISFFLSLLSSSFLQPRSPLTAAPGTDLLAPNSLLPTFLEQPPNFYLLSYRKATTSLLDVLNLALPEVPILVCLSPPQSAHLSYSSIRSSLPIPLPLQYMMNRIFQNKYTNSANIEHHWKAIDKRDLHDSYKNSHDYKER